VDLRLLPPLFTHVPEDMTVTVTPCLTLAELQAGLGRRGQWLPLDPPNPGRLTLSELIATNASGPRRFGYGGIRDHLIGLEVVLGDGRLVHSGGKVVKNVAGYDLLKLFVGDQGSLGVVVEATFKLLPLPEREQWVQARCATLAEAGARIEAVLEQAITPVVLDLHGAASASSLGLTLGFAGTREEVDWQLAEAGGLGFSEPGNLDHETHFHAPGLAPPQRASVLPSRLVEFIGILAPESFVARAGQGVVYYRGGPPPPKDGLPMKLNRRIKETFDPRHVFPDAPL